MATDADSNFLRAVRAGNLEEVQLYLERGQDVNTVNINGLSGLHLAAKEGHADVMVELLNSGADLEARTRKDNTPLHVAALARQSQITRLLLDRGADVNAVSKTGFTPLYLAAQENGADIVDMLLQAGADQRIHTVDGFSPLAVAVQQENAEVINVLLPSWRKTAADYALRMLASKDQATQNSPDVFKLAADGNVIGLRKAVQNGANVNQTLKDGLSPLHLAVVLGNLQMVQELISHGASPNTASSKLSTPLGTACHVCRRDIIHTLLLAGADPNVKTRPCDPLLPLHISCNYGDTASVFLLLQHRADVIAAGRWMSMNARVAFDEQHSEVMSLLIRWSLRLCPEQQIKFKLMTPDVDGDTDTLQSATTPDEPEPDPTVTCLGMMSPVFRSRPRLVDSLVEAALDATNKTTLSKAAEEGNLEMAMACLDESPAAVDNKSKCGVTALHLASLMGHTAIVSLLLERKANVNAATDKGLTPAILAAYANHPQVLQVLLKWGADLSLSMQNGLTPLGMAIAKQSLQAAEFILNHQPLAPPCNILNILSTQTEEVHEVSKVLSMVEWACRSNPLTAGDRRKKGRRACVVT